MLTLESKVVSASATVRTNFILHAQLHHRWLGSNNSLNITVLFVPVSHFVLCVCECVFLPLLQPTTHSCVETPWSWVVYWTEHVSEWIEELRRNNTQTHNDSLVVGDLNLWFPIFLACDNWNWSLTCFIFQYFTREKKTQIPEKLCIFPRSSL